jgi:hypothetical protein
MANKRKKSKAIAQHNLERMLNGSAYQDMTERVLREDAARQHCLSGLVEEKAARLKKFKAGLPLLTKGHHTMAALDQLKLKLPPTMDELHADAKKQADGLKLKPPVADGPRAKRTKALVAHLKKLKAGLPLPVKGQNEAAPVAGNTYAVPPLDVKLAKEIRQRLRRFITKLDDTPMQLFRRDMAKAGERYMCKHGVSAAEAVCVMSDFVAAWAFRAVHEFSCPSRKKGEKECKCVRH